MSELLNRIDNESVQELRRAFDKLDKLELEAFVQVMQKAVQGIHVDERVKERVRKWSAAICTIDETSIKGKWVVEQAIELFKQVDANGDGEVDWGEFSAFIIEMNKNQELAKEELQDIQLIPDSCDVKLNLQRKVCFLQPSFSGTKLGLVEEASDQFKIHSFENRNGHYQIRFQSAVRVTSNFISHRVVGGCLVESRNQAVVATKYQDEFFLSLYDLGQVVTRREQVNMKSGQRILKYHPQTDYLCTTGTSRGEAKGYIIYLFKRNPRTGTLLENGHRSLVWHHKIITSMEFLTPHHLVSASLDGSACLWDLTYGERLNAITMHETGIQMLSSLSFVPDDEAAWSSFWVRVKRETVVAHMASCPKPRFGDKISAPEKSCAAVWHISDSFEKIELHCELLGHKFPTTAVQTIPGDGFVLTCDFSGECRLWSPEKEYECVQVVRIGCPVFLWTQSMLLTLKALENQGRDQLYRFTRVEKERSRLVMCAFNETMKCVVTVTRSEVVIWDLQTYSRLPILRLDMEMERREFTAACFDDRERKLLLGDDCGVVTVHNLMNGAKIKTLDPHSLRRPITSLHFCPQDRLAIATAWGGAVFFYDEENRLGFVPNKSSVKLRSISCSDSTGQTVDIACSAVSSFLKQVATFGDRKLSPNRSESESPSCEDKTSLFGHRKPQLLAPQSSGGVVCVWDMEFARLCGVCETDIGCNYVALEFVHSNTPNLAGLDAATNAVSIWVTHEENRYCNFNRVYQIELGALGLGVTPCLMKLLSERQECDGTSSLDLSFWVGVDNGMVKHYCANLSLNSLSQPVRAATYRGNRQAHNSVVLDTAASEKRRRRASIPPATSISCTPKWSVHCLSTSAAYSQPTTMSIVQHDRLIFVGFENGLFSVLKLDTGEICSSVDVFVATKLDEINGLNLTRLQAARDKETSQVLARLQSLKRLQNTRKTTVASGEKKDVHNPPTCQSPTLPATPQNQDPDKDKDKDGTGKEKEEDPLNVLFGRLNRARVARMQDRAQRRPSTTQTVVLPPLHHDEFSPQAFDEKGESKMKRTTKKKKTRASLRRIKLQNAAMDRLSASGSSSTKRPNTAPNAQSALH